MANASLMHEAGHPKPVLWDNPEGYRGEGGERGGSAWVKHVYLWLIHVDVWQEPSQYCKVTILINFLNVCRTQKET